MRKLLTMIFAWSLVLFLTGCATVMRGSGRTIASVSIITEPQEANITCDGQRLISPTTVNLDKATDHSIIITKNGYNTVNIKLRSGVRPFKGVGASFVENTAAWGWWTLGIGTAAGMIVDAASGSMKDLNTTEIYIQLEPGEGVINMTDADLLKVQKEKQDKTKALNKK